MTSQGQGILLTRPIEKRVLTTFLTLNYLSYDHLPLFIYFFKKYESDVFQNIFLQFLFNFFYTGDIALLQIMPATQRPATMEYVDVRRDSPFHTLLKMSRCPQGTFLATIVRLLLRKGVSPTVRDQSQRLPIDYVNRQNNKQAYGILKKYTQREFLKYICIGQMISIC